MSRKQSRKLLLLLIPLVVGLVVALTNSREPEAVSARQPAAGYLFCFWNVENLFDDHHDGRAHEADKQLDGWFARDPQALKQKLAHVSKALIELNDGRGPDILAVAELENLRAAELLRDSLNAQLEDPTLHYKHVLMKDPSGGRHIATAIITRLPVRGDKTQLHGRRLRILEGHVVVNGHDLAILATHWTSRVTDEHGEQRYKYGDQIHGVYKGMHQSNPKVDFLVCGDFNDPPEAPSVTAHLHATGDRQAVLDARSLPLLFNPFAGKDPRRFGTIYYQSTWSIFDQIAVSPGLLENEGWSCDTDSVQTVNGLYRSGDKARRPWSFGRENDQRARGYSDHFPVTIRLKVREE